MITRRVLSRSAPIGLGLWLLLGPATALPATVSTSLVSVSLTGGAGNGPSFLDAVSPNGRYVLFDSRASNLVAGDTNGVQDVFLRDRTTGRTFRVSTGPAGRQANGRSLAAAVSPNGRFVAFTSTATNLTRLPDTNHIADVFLKDRATGLTHMVSFATNGAQFTQGFLTFGAVMAGNGRWVAFTHQRGDRWITYLRDRKAKTTRVIDHRMNTQPGAITPDGRYLALYREDDHGVPFQLQIRDLAASHEIEVPSSDDPRGGLLITPDASYVAYYGLNPTGMGTDVFRWHHGSKKSTAVLVEPSSFATESGLSSDGRYVAVNSDDPALVTGDTNNATDEFRRDLTMNQWLRTSLANTGAQLAGGGTGEGLPTATVSSVMTSDGSLVAFTTPSRAAPTDTNRFTDVYIRGPL